MDSRSFLLILENGAGDQSCSGTSDRQASPGERRVVRMFHDVLRCCTNCLLCLISRMTSMVRLFLLDDESAKGSLEIHLM